MDPHARCLRSAAAGRVQKAQEGPIAQRIAVIGCRSSQDAVDRFGAHHLRQVLPQFGRAQQLHRAFGQHAVEHEIPKEHFQRHEVPRNRRRSQTPAMQMVEKTGQDFQIDLEDRARPVLVEPCEKLNEIGPVRGDRVRRHARFGLQIVEECRQMHGRTGSDQGCRCRPRRGPFSRWHSLAPSKKAPRANRLPHHSHRKTSRSRSSQVLLNGKIRSTNDERMPKCLKPEMRRLCSSFELSASCFFRHSDFVLYISPLQPVAADFCRRRRSPCGHRRQIES